MMTDFRCSTLLESYGMLNTEAFRALLQNTPDYIFVKNMESVYVAASMPFARMVNLSSPEEIIGRTDIEVFKDAALASRYTMDDQRVLQTEQNQINFLEPIADKNGRARYSATSKYVLKDQNNKTIGLLGVGRDVTGEYLAQQHYQQELKYLFELPEDMYAATFIDIDDWRIINQHRQEIKGVSLPVCSNVEDLLKSVRMSILDDNGEGASFFRDFSKVFLKGIYESGKRDLSFNYPRNMSDGSMRWIRAYAKFLLDPYTNHLCLMLNAEDIDAEKQDEIELHHAAERDALTGLFNRAYADKHIPKLLSEDLDHKHALFMLDVDNFKSLNDTQGHAAGDEFLIAAASALKQCFRENDIVGRLGGDEFFVFMKDVGQKSTVQKKAETLLSSIKDICVRYPSVDLSVSIGVSLYPEHGVTLDELYVKADKALYRAKDAGKGRVRFYDR